MSPTIARSMVVDLNDLPTNEFHEDILGSYRILLDTWKETEPHMFGNELIDGLEFVGFEMYEVTNRTYQQKHRKRGQSTEYKELKQSISENGWKVKYPPPCIIRHGSVETEATGNTRFEALAALGITNCPVAVYRFRDGVDATQQKSIQIRTGQIFQPPRDPASPPAMEDIAGALEELCHIGEVNADDYAEIMTVCDELCRGGNFDKTKRNAIALSVYNNIGTNGKILAWSSTRTNLSKPDTVMKKSFKFVDTDKVIYESQSYDAAANAVTKACKLWNDNPSKEIRIVIHTGVLDATSFDFQECYESRITKFYDKFNALLQMVTHATGGDYEVVKKRIVVYAAFPAIEEIHNLDEPLFFNHKTEEVYQKKTGYSFSLV